MTARAFSLRRASFVVLMLVLTAVFAALGTWQALRLGEKEALIHAVAERETSAPVPLPPATAWPLDPRQFDYQPVSLAGRYLPAATVLVFTSLADARGAASGPGYWVVTPFALTDGGTVFVNQGFVPQSRRAEFATGGTVPTGETTITGLARATEAVGSFTPAPDRANRIEWVRNTERLAAMAGDLPAPVANLTVDLPAGAPGALPQGGETVVSFPNNHLGYAITWFGFALMTPILLAFWLMRREKPGATS